MNCEVAAALLVGFCQPFFSSSVLFLYLGIVQKTMFKDI